MREGDEGGTAPHPPLSAEPANLGTVSPASILRDVLSGETSSYEQWLAACMARESRSREECTEQLMNAIARGDIVIPD